MSYEGKNSRQDGYYGTNTVIIAAFMAVDQKQEKCELTLYRFSQIRIRNLSWTGLISRKLVPSKKESLKYIM